MTHRLFVAVVLLVAGAARAASPDTLFLKDGSIRIGSLMGRDSSYTQMRVSGEMLLVPNRDVVRSVAERDAPVRPHGPAALEFLGGAAFPGGIDFPIGYGAAAGFRYRFGSTIDVRVEVAYMLWQQTVNVVSQIDLKTTDTVRSLFEATGVPFLLGVSYVLPAGPRGKIEVGADAGAIRFSANVQESRAETRFAAGAHVLFTYPMSPNVSVEAGARFRSFSTTMGRLSNSDQWNGKVSEILAPTGAVRVSALFLGGGIVYHL